MWLLRRSISEWYIVSIRHWHLTIYQGKQAVSQGEPLYYSALVLLTSEVKNYTSRFWCRHKRLSFGNCTNPLRLFDCETGVFAWKCRLNLPPSKFFCRKKLTVILLTGKGAKGVWTIRMYKSTTTDLSPDKYFLRHVVLRLLSWQILARDHICWHLLQNCDTWRYLVKRT